MTRKLSDCLEGTLRYLERERSLLLAFFVIGVVCFGGYAFYFSIAGDDMSRLVDYQRELMWPIRVGRYLTALVRWMSPGPLPLNGVGTFALYFSFCITLVRALQKAGVANRTDLFISGCLLACSPLLVDQFIFYSHRLGTALGAVLASLAAMQLRDCLNRKNSRWIDFLPALMLTVLATATQQAFFAYVFCLTCWLLVIGERRMDRITVIRLAAFFITSAVGYTISAVTVVEAFGSGFEHMPYYALDAGYVSNWREMAEALRAVIYAVVEFLFFPQQYSPILGKVILWALLLLCLFAISKRKERGLGKALLLILVLLLAPFCIAIVRYPINIKYSVVFGLALFAPAVFLLAVNSLEFKQHQNLARILGLTWIAIMVFQHNSVSSMQAIQYTQSLSYAQGLAHAIQLHLSPENKTAASNRPFTIVAVGGPPRFNRPNFSQYGVRHHSVMHSNSVPTGAHREAVTLLGAVNPGFSFRLPVRFHHWIKNVPSEVRSKLLARASRLKPWPVEESFFTYKHFLIIRIGSEADFRKAIRRSRANLR